MLAPEAPYPLAGGGALRTASLLQHLAANLCRRPDRLPAAGRARSRGTLPAGLVRRVCRDRLAAERRSLAARALRNAVRVARAVPPLVDRFSGFDRQIAEAVAGRRYEVGIIEHFWCAPYWSRSRRFASEPCWICTISSPCCTRAAREVGGHATAFAHRVFRQASLRTGARLAAAILPGAGHFGRATPELARAIAPRRPCHGLSQCHSAGRRCRRGG